MPPQVLWISVWTTLALWLGSIGGCASRPQVPADAQTTRPSANGSTMVINQPMAVVDGVNLSKPSSTTTEHGALEPMADIESPSLRGLDRSHWTKVTVGPADGQTTHYPIYFSDYPLDAPVPNLSNLPDTQAQLEAALQDPGAGHYNQANLQGMAIQPLKAGFDLLVAPVRMFMDPPLKVVPTP